MSGIPQAEPAVAGGAVAGGAVATRDFPAELVGQVRAADSYGRLDGVPDARLLQPYLVKVGEPGEIPLMCMIDAAAVERLRAFFRAVAAGVERGTGVTANYALDLDSEGFGRAIVFVGRLVVLCEVLRDVNGFGFRDVEQLAAHGTALIRAALQTATAYPEVTRVEP